MTDRDPVALSTALLSGVRAGEDTAARREALAALDPDRLAVLRDDARKAFWLNVYNAFVQHRLEERPERFENRRRFFAAESVPVAGRTLSLDDVEHGILRRSQLSVGLGYLKRPDVLVSEFVQRTRVDERDPRIHFALNCGAASCPPIAAYSREEVDRELDLAAESYLQAEVEYDPEAGRALVPRPFLWFRGDFGGRSGIYEFLRRYGPVPEGERPTVSYGEYAWSLSPGDYREEPLDRA